MNRFLILMFAYVCTSTLCFSQFKIDSSFNTFNNNEIYNVDAVVNQNGKLVIAGGFTKIAGVKCSHICRLLNDSVVDPTFMSGTGFNNYVKKMIVLPNNKLLVMGSFTSYSTANINYLMRLNPDGTPDLTFVPNFDAGSVLTDFVVQPDGKVIVIGVFNTYSGNARKNIVRLSGNGSLDMGFNCGNSNNGVFNKVVLQSTGNIILIGDFASHLSTTVSSIVRLLPTGLVDAGFSCTLPLNTSNKVVLSDIFIHSNDDISLPRNDLYPSTFLRLNSNGGAVSNYPFTVNPKSLLLANGNFLTMPGYMLYTGNVAFPKEISPNGSIVKDYSTFGWFFSNDWTGTEYIPLFEVAGKIYMSCNYFEDYTPARRKLIRLTENNIVDYHFLPIGGPNFAVTEMAKYDSDSYIIIGGFTRIGSSPVQTIAKVDKSCAVITSFNAGGVGFNGPALCVAVQQDGKIIVGGDFTTYNNQPANRLVRLMENGTIDPTFNVGVGTDYPIYDIQILDADHILLGGNFSTYQGAEAYNIVCVKHDGALNNEFNTNVGAGTNGRVRKINVIGSHIYLIGDFNFFNGNLRKHIVRINFDGTFDTSFDPGQGDNGLVNDVAEFENKIYVVGQFTQFASKTTRSMAILNMDGTIDDSQYGSNYETGFNIAKLSNSLIYTAAYTTSMYDAWTYQSFSLTRQDFYFNKRDLASGWLSYPPTFSVDSTSYYLNNFKVLIDGADFFIYGASIEGPAFMVKYKSLNGDVTTKNTSSQSLVKKELSYSIVQGSCTFIDADNSKGTLYVYDLNGRELFSDVYQTNTRIDISNYKPGLYIAKFESDQNTISTVKIVVTGE